MSIFLSQIAARHTSVRRSSIRLSSICRSSVCRSSVRRSSSSFIPNIGASLVSAIMDRSWMSIRNRACSEYENGVEEFLKFALDHGCDSTRMICPCKNCCYSRRISVDKVREHLIFHGIISDYTRWIWHGEKSVDPDSTACEDFVSGGSFGVSEDSDDRLDDMMDDIQGLFANDPDKFEEMVNHAKMPLYSGCTKFTKLSALLKLYNLKARHGWSDSSFNDILELMKDILPEDNSLPVSTYEAKKILCSTGMTYERIHACPNDCVLYRNEHASKDKCPNPDCGEPRYKKQGVPAKVLWYFPIIQRFRRLFGNSEDAKNLTWYADERIKDGKIRHPVDATQWKKIDELYPQFGNEDRNLRLALSSDGMNPHGNMSTSHSTVPKIWYGKKDSFSENEIDEVRKEWIEYLLELMF